MNDLAEIASHVADPAWLLRRNLFVAEGRHVTRRLIESARYPIVGLLMTPVAEEAMADAVATLSDVSRPSVMVRSQADLDRLTGFRLHQGCVAIAERRPLPVWEAALSNSEMCVLLERVRDPDNVGSIIRSAAAMGVGAVLVGPECADPLYRKTVRTSMGAVLTSTVVAAAPWPDVLDRLKVAGYSLVATTPDPGAESIEHAAARLARPVALLVGSEGEGLTMETRRCADLEVRIPMAAATDSLNVAVATAVAVYALSRRV